PRASVSRLAAPPRIPPVSFQSLVHSSEKRQRGKGGLTTTVSLVVHSVLIATMIVVPVLLDDFLPEPDRTVRAFFVSPVGIAPPPPPPPPPAAGARNLKRAPAVPRPPDAAPKFVAPVEIPDEIVPEAGIDLGVEGGVPGGVEGGVPGGVVGGIVGGLPQEVKEEAQYIRVGGNIKAPKLIRNVQPEYPMLAQQARVQGFVILEARVGVDGAVQAARVIRSIPLLDEAALAAVQQWRYQPLLLNGTPMPFVLTVTVVFKISQ
ncbi:MAG TPA: energy transducer TonB, partial [Vicinamibacteria bacterium]|nr:energy transducer TonB [Vicinamibacteria bacterium]